MKRLLWALSAYALGAQAFHFHQSTDTGSTLLATLFFIGTVCAIQQMVTKYPWQRVK